MTRKQYRIALSCALLILLLPSLLSAQTSPVAVAIPLDDPRLFHALFLNPASQTKIAVNAIDGVKAAALAVTAAQRLAALEAQRQAYLAPIQSKKQS